LDSAHPIIPPLIIIIIVIVIIIVIISITLTSLYSYREQNTVVYLP
jgi:hypothetical protein